MTLKEVFDKTSWGTLSDELVKRYPDQRKSLDGYRAVCRELSLTEPEMSRLTIEIVMDTDDDGVSFPWVHGIESDSDTTWSLILMPWTECLGMEVCEETLSEFSIAQVAAYCPYEMTFFGFTREDREEVGKRMKEPILGDNIVYLPDQG